MPGKRKRPYKKYAPGQKPAPGGEKPARDEKPARGGQSAGGKGPRRNSSEVGVRKTADGQAWELRHPRCACDRADDLEEVQKMITADETEIAVDELRWLLSGCTDFIDAHKTLGELALLDRDVPLARGHFGYAYQIGLKALDRAGVRGPVPYRMPANQAFFESGKGLAICLRELGKPEMAAEVAQRLLECDPSDPLGLRQLLPTQ